MINLASSPWGLGPTLMHRTVIKIFYSVHKCTLDEVLSKIKPSIVQKKMIPHMKAKVIVIGKKKNEKIEKKKSKWPTKKKLVIQLHQFSIFVHKNFMLWSYALAWAKSSLVYYLSIWINNWDIICIRFQMFLSILWTHCRRQYALRNERQLSP